MIRPRTMTVLFAAILLLSAMPAFAWDDTGHKITGYIAWQTMTPEVRERVIKILLASPEDSQVATFYASYGSQTVDMRKRDFFMLITSWADIVRDRNFPERYKKYHKSNWHYADTFWMVKDGKIEVLPAPEEGGRALERIVEYDRVIRGDASDAQKAIAIAWLEHLIGDMHQPLHSSARVTDTEPKGDQGGNTFLITPEGTPRDKQENLHWFWDSIIVRNLPNSKNQCDDDYLNPIAQKIMRMYPYAKMQNRLEINDFAAWAKESLAAAQKDVFSNDLKRFQTPSPQYKKKALKVAEERLALAGYRMGDLFNQVFKTDAVPK